MICYNQPWGRYLFEYDGAQDQLFEKCMEETMSEMEESAAYRAEESSTQENRFDPMAIHAETGSQESLEQIQQTLENADYLTGQVPQVHNFDPQALQALNSERLIGTINFIEKALFDLGRRVEEEIGQVQKFQKKINLWEDRIEKNKHAIQASQAKIRQNNIDIAYDKKNRDYWFSRAEEVMMDFQAAMASNRKADWSWLIKKYCLKNADGTEIDAGHIAVEELCNGEADNLAGQYRAAGNKYEMAKKDRETENTRLIRENSTLLSTNEQLQGFIANTYQNEIEPLQDGILLLKEAGVKLKGLQGEGQSGTYGELRSWAEAFLDDFLKSNPKVPQAFVTEFRRLSSISLPATNN